MRRRDDTGAAVHAQRTDAAHGQVLREPRKRAPIQGMEGAKEQPRHGLDACRSFRMPPTRRKAAHRKSYRIADVLLVIVTAFCVASVLWGYGCAYQVGYGAAEHFFTEVRHG